MKKIVAIAATAVLTMGVSLVSFGASAVTNSGLNKAMPKDLLLLCVRTQHDGKVCGYFSRAAVKKLPQSARKDLYWSVSLGLL